MTPAPRTAHRRISDHIRAAAGRATAAAQQQHPTRPHVGPIFRFHQTRTAPPTLKSSSVHDGPHPAMLVTIRPASPAAPPADTAPPRAPNASVLHRSRPSAQLKSRQVTEDVVCSTLRCGPTRRCLLTRAHVEGRLRKGGGPVGSRRSHVEPWPMEPIRQPGHRTRTAAVRPVHPRACSARSYRPGGTHSQAGMCPRRRVDQPWAVSRPREQAAAKHCRRRTDRFGAAHARGHQGLHVFKGELGTDDPGCLRFGQATLQLVAQRLDARP